MTRMPPQAYTKEVLASAFDWLSRQNETVKKTIRNSDDLVGLYLKSTRLKENAHLLANQEGSQNTSASYNNADLSSAKSFRSELQGLALNLKQFEDKPQADEVQPREPMSDYMHELSLMMNTQPAAATPVQPSRSTPLFTQQQQEPPMPTPIKEQSPSVLPDTAETVLLKLDKKTITAINLAKERLNLSSNTEAIRVLVSLGEKHLKKIFGAEE